jgi:Flp pilus assembly pilin Flp
MLQAFPKDDSGATAIEYGLIASLISVAIVAVAIVATVVNWVLEQLFGPNVPENPNYEIIQDISSLVPWWFPHTIAGCAFLFLILLWANNRRGMGGRHSSGEPPDMEDPGFGLVGRFTDHGRRNQSVNNLWAPGWSG